MPKSRTRKRPKTTDHGFDLERIMMEAQGINASMALLKILMPKTYKGKKRERYDGETCRKLRAARGVGPSRRLRKKQSPLSRRGPVYFREYGEGVSDDSRKQTA